MTKEERLDWLCRLRSEIYVFMPKEWLKPMDEALTDSIKSIEQEPKTGHWIKLNVGYGCSECSLATNEYGKNDYKYCPNCGARMSEVEE